MSISHCDSPMPARVVVKILGEGNSENNVQISVLKLITDILLYNIENKFITGMHLRLCGINSINNYHASA